MLGSSSTCFPTCRYGVIDGKRQQLVSRRHSPTPYTTQSCRYRPRGDWRDGLSCPAWSLNYNQPRWQQNTKKQQKKKTDLHSSTSVWTTVVNRQAGMCLIFFRECAAWYRCTARLKWIEPTGITILRLPMHSRGLFTILCEPYTFFRGVGGHVSLLWGVC